MTPYDTSEWKDADAAPQGYPLNHSDYLQVYEFHGVYRVIEFNRPDWFLDFDTIDDAMEYMGIA